MTAAPPTFDALVLGGGPAGSAAASLLARRGHRVALLTRPAPPWPTLAESIPPSARKLLQAVGFLEATEGAGFFPNLGNTVWWAGAEGRVEPFRADAPGFHVERGRWEAVLLEEARRAGVTVLASAGGRRPTRAGGAWRVEVPAAPEGAPARTLRAPWLLDATGRSGVMARTGLRAPDDGPRTLALVRRWRGAGAREGSADRPEAHHTLVESYADGWAWSVPLAAGERCVTVMVDPELTGLERGVTLGRTYDAELGKTSHLRGRLGGWAPSGRVRACPASLYGARSVTAEGLLLVGDAGSFIDPLSSYGVKKALASAWLAAVVVHTALADPAMTEVALAHFEAREREVVGAYRRVSVRFLSEAADAYRHAYWSRRAEAARRAGDDAEQDDPRAPDDEPWSGGGGGRGAVVPNDAVRAAFEWIRAQEDLALAPGRGGAWEERAVVEDGRVALRRHFARGGTGEAVRFVRGVELERLCALAPRHADVPALWEAYNRGATPVPLPDFLAALATAVAAGALAARG